MDPRLGGSTISIRVKARGRIEAVLAKFVAPPKSCSDPISRNVGSWEIRSASLMSS